MKNRIILLVGMYDILDIFSYELEKAFLEMKYEVLMFHVDDMKNSLRKMSEFVQKPVVAALTFNNLGTNMELKEGCNVWEQLQIPCINILMDHPFSHHRAMQMTPKNGIVLTIDKKHVDYLMRFYPEVGMAGFLPHGGKELPGEKKPISNRSIDVLYVGGLSKSFTADLIPKYQEYTKFDCKKLCETAYETLIHNPSLTTEEVLEHLLRAEMPEISDAELCQLIAELHVVEMYVVSYFRLKIMETLAKAGISLTIYGSGWEKEEFIKLPNVFFGGRISAEEAVEKMKDTKIVLSTMTWFKDGTHDRVFNGMLQRAVAVTDSSNFMKENFKEDEVQQFELTEIATLPDKINALLQNPEKMQELADVGYERAKKDCTWKARAIELHEDLLKPLGGLQ